MYVLGISCFYHDSSACLLKDGALVAAAQEERFTRRKHDTSFPINAINYCLESQGISGMDLEAVAFYEKPILKFERVLHQHLEMFPKTYKNFVKLLPNWFSDKLRVMKKIKKEVKYKGEVFFIDHHLAHAASSFYVSPFDKAAILTVDGVGEWTTTAYGVGEKNKINLLKELRFPHSIGLLYSTITAYLGFSVNNSEYKVMGLSPYGNMNKKTNPYYKKLKEVIDIKPDGSYNLDMSYFTYHFSDRMPSEKLCDLLGGPIRKGESELESRHKDIAAAVQLITEEVMIKILNDLHKKVKTDNIVLSGGVALNSVGNGKLLKNSPFKKIWIHPDPGDGGTSVGAAFYVYNGVFGKKRKFVLNDAYLGPGFSSEEVRKFLDENKIKYSEIKKDRDLVNKVANLLYTDNVIGWFQGRMEWGPRALGSRSILSNPCNPDMQEILNSKVKHREKFRPFAPVVCVDDASKYFKCDTPIPLPTDYMLMVYPVIKKWHKKIPSVTHVDGSGRLQTIRRSQNPLYHDVIKKFGKLSKIPILINTSFNIRGEPIVCTPKDAFKCMMGTGIDYLIMNNFVIKREDNPQHMWDSEKYAKD